MARLVIGIGHRQIGPWPRERDQTLTSAGAALPGTWRYNRRTEVGVIDRMTAPGVSALGSRADVRGGDEAAGGDPAAGRMTGTTGPAGTSERSKTAYGGESADRTETAGSIDAAGQTETTLCAATASAGGTSGTGRIGPADTAGAVEQSEMRRILGELHAESYAWAVSCCKGDPAEGTDVLQTAYVKVLNGDARFEGRSSARTWFFGVVRRTAQERRRRAFVRERILAVFARGAAGREAQAPMQEAALASSERACALREALGRLPERQRQVLRLVFQHDLTLDDAGRALGIAPGSARTHYERGKKRLRELLSKNEDHHE